MTESEYKKQLIDLGVTEEEVAKIDFSMIEKIISESKDIDDMCNKVLSINPSADVQALKDAIKNKIQEQDKTSDTAEDLSEESLEEVAGGSLGSWIKKNKEWLIPVAGLALTGAVAGGVALYKHFNKPVDSYNLINDVPQKGLLAED